MHVYYEQYNRYTCTCALHVSHSVVNPVPTHVPTGSLSQQSCSNLTQSTFYNTQQPNTQQTDSTILAPNTQLSQMGVVRKGGLNQSSVGVTKVNESVIKEEVS